jgi:predicted protein tyrosine phosphatase
MTIIVCPLSEAPHELRRSRPARLITLLAPEQDAPDAPADLPRLILRFHDIAEPQSGYIAPSQAMVAKILAFGAEWREPEPLLIHCWMGISRSTAAALIIACAVNPVRDEAEIAQALRDASPTATPNRLMVALADEQLGRQGRLIAAAASIGQGEYAYRGKTFSLLAR